jgi:hypothetical protein
MPLFHSRRKLELALRQEDRMTETLSNVLSVLGLAAACLVGALTILVLALASRIVKETRQ